MSLCTSFLCVLAGDNEVRCRDRRARRLVCGVAARTVRGRACTLARGHELAARRAVQAARRSYR